jgi:hypothetical protein
MPDDNDNRELTLQHWGWVLFVLSSGLFIISSIKNRDLISLAASLLFLAGCVLFVISLKRWQ